MGHLPLLMLPRSKVQEILFAALMTPNNKMPQLFMCKIMTTRLVMLLGINSFKIQGSDLLATRNLILSKKKLKLRSTQMALSSQMKQSGILAINSTSNSSCLQMSLNWNSRNLSERMVLEESRIVRNAVVLTKFPLLNRVLPLLLYRSLV